MIELSAIVPVGERRSDFRDLYGEYHAALQSLGRPYELIFVLDGPNAQALQELVALQDAGADDIVVIRLARYFGEATALMAGFAEARGEVILTLPAYHQIEAQDIHKLVEALDQSDMSIGRREPRAGGSMERLRRATFHGLIRRVTGLRFKDLGCGARAMKRRVIEELSLYGDQHRFLPVLADRQGLAVKEIEVRQSPKDRFEGRYRTRDYAHRALDILTLLFIVRFTKKPLRFFGMVGVVTLGAGALLLLWLVIERTLFDIPLADRPALLLASLLAVVGLQLFALGLLGELMIFTHASQLKDYQIERVIQFAPPADDQSLRTAPDASSAAGPREQLLTR